MQIEIDQKECELGDDIAILDQYHRLTQAIENDAKLHSKECFDAQEDENQIVSEINQLTQQIAKIKVSSVIKITLILCLVCIDFIQETSFRYRN